MIEPLVASAVGAAATVCFLASVATKTDTTVSGRLQATEAVRGGRWRAGIARLGAAKWTRSMPRQAGASRSLALSRWTVPEDEMMGWRVILAILCVVVALAAPFPVRLLAPVFAVVGFRAPDFVCSRVARRHLREADREMPLLLDVMAAACSAGLSGQLAFRRAVGATEGLLSEELGRVIRSVDLGARWRDELRTAAEHLGLADLGRAAATIARAESLGSSLAESLLQLSDDVRDSRRAAATERARKAPVKMLFPLVFLILPAFLLLTVVPVLVTTVRSIG
jgi:tight adherence protein C